MNNPLAFRVTFEDHVLVKADVLEGVIRVAEQGLRCRVYRHQKIFNKYTQGVWSRGMMFASHLCASAKGRGFNSLLVQPFAFYLFQFA